MTRHVIFGLNLILFAVVQASSLLAQQPVLTDVAAYQLGVVAEALPGSDLTYTITVTNYGPSIVETFYILDGWTLNDDGISGFVMPVAQPDFGEFELLGIWEQARPDEIVTAWLLQGELIPGDTLQFDWTVKVDAAYQGALVNWVSILTEEGPQGVWETRAATTLPLPPPIASAVDANPDNNRTTDGVTIVTNTPTGEGIDLALYQTGILTEIPAGQPLTSTWLIANLGPQPVTQFYVITGGSLNSDGTSVLVQPMTEPDFGNFEVLGRWQQSTADEKQWLWLLQGNLSPGESVVFDWERTLVPDYRGDLITWAAVSGRDVPSGIWLPCEGTSAAPLPIGTLADTFPENDSSIEALTTIRE